MFKALFEAFFNLFKKPDTTTFPATAHQPVAASRGAIGYSAEACIFCLKCEKACPPAAILFIRDASGEDTYYYNPYLCIFCGECVRACPKPDEALWQEEQPVFSSVDGAISKRWFEMEREAIDSKLRYKKAKRTA